MNKAFKYFSYLCRVLTINFLESQPYRKSMKQKAIFYVMLIACFFMASCKNAEEKSAKSTDPVDIIETLSNDISQLSDEWTKEQWDDAADMFENALSNLPKSMTNDEETIVSSSVSRMKVYAERHRRRAAELLGALEKYSPSKAEAATQPVAQPAAASQPVPPAVSQPAPALPPMAGLLTAHVIREGGYTNVRQGPGTNYGIVTKIKDGSPIYYTEYNKNWYQVYNASGQLLGFMHSSKVIPSEAPVAQSSRVATGTEFDWLANRYVTEADLRYSNASQLRILRNAIYARHGYRFKDAGLRQFFNTMQWYDGYRSEIPESEFNKFEKYNINFIKKHE